MKHSIFICFFSGLLLAGCVNDNSNTKRQSPNEETTRDSTQVTNALFNAELSQKISDFIATDDSLASSRSSFVVKPVILVEFFKKDRECFILISHSYLYNEDSLLGCIVQSERMIAFYSDGDCINGFVNTALLQQPPINHFQSKEESTVPSPPFNPRYREYRISELKKLLLHDRDGRL